jgi:hypothetical protein
MEPTGGGVLGLPPSDGGNDGPTTSGYSITLLMMTSGGASGLSASIHPNDRDHVAQD